MPWLLPLITPPQTENRRFRSERGIMNVLMASKKTDALYVCDIPV